MSLAYVRPQLVYRALCKLEAASNADTHPRAVPTLVEEALNALKDARRIGCWIKCATEMPPYGAYVLVKRGTNGRRVIARRTKQYSCKCSKRRLGVIYFDFINRNNAYIEADHWMPLP